MKMKYVRKYIKPIACFLALSILIEICLPTTVYALTGGPSQPEVQSFEPAGTSEMVDLFSGDFNYNIPLLDVDGYPINISYHSGIGMDDEASWVGLGWNINPGVINRSMRGLPDDFSGDEVNNEFNIRTNRTIGLNTDLKSLEIFGLQLPKNTLPINFGVRYNNYKGVGYNFGTSLGRALGPFEAGLGLKYDSEGGFGIAPSISFSKTLIDEEKEAIGGLKMSVGGAFNSRSGMQSLNYGGSFTPQNHKKVENKIGLSGSSSYSFGTKTWVPSISMPMRSISVSLNATVGTDFFGSHPGVRFGGSYSEQSLLNRSVSKKAYGYYYEQNNNGDDVLRDFNRERDGSFNENSTNLPLANHTYDILSASGQGIGGSFRSKRSDIPSLHDDRAKTSNVGGSVGLEFGVGNLVHSGVDVMVNYNSTESGLWQKGNSLLPLYTFKRSAHADYEPAYFKSKGDVTPVDKDFHEAQFGDEAVRPNTLNGNVISPSYKKKKNTSQESYALPKDRNNTNIAKQRAKRNQVMSFLSADEAQVFGKQSKIEHIPINSLYTDNEFVATEIDRVDANKKAWHMSEISVLKEDGMRYIYGIPAYNNKTVEKTFNIGSQTNISTVCQTGEATYSAGVDNTKGNTQGLDYFFSGTTTPAYAHSFLLTGVLSPDYVDLTNDGISDDDLGSAVKFNYTRAHENYRWRVPYNQNKANYSEGLKSNTNDDKASYAYGEKEIWYAHSVEGKNHVALFKISSREDGLGVLGEDGGKDVNQKQYKLDKIELYAKQDLIRNGVNATPIKVVHLKYDYDLCPNVDNNSGVVVTGNDSKGKLTLTEIYFTYGKSGKGRLNSYKFNYSSVNPGYELKGHDMWGNYKPAPGNCCGSEANLSNSDFPYVDQDKVQADLNATAWTLTEVQLPSGGKILIDYESDDYAYVQNRQAMQMFKIKGFGYDNEGNIVKDENKIYSDVHYDLVFFELKSAITGPDAAAELKQKYLSGIEDLQFTVFADINNKGQYEYVKGYAETDLSRCGVVDNGNTGWVAMKKVKIGDKHPVNRNKEVSPVARGVWNFARMNAPHLVYPYSPDNAADVKKQMLSLLAIYTDVFRMVEGFNHSLELQHFGEKFNKEKSWLRLLSPDKSKLGGGARVKKIRMNDNWATMGSVNTGASDEEYGQEYSYTMEEKQSNGETWTISSGVASFEPGIGRDENPFVLPRVVTVENKLVPNEDILMEEPIGESFYPGPSVGYRKVTVKSLTKTGVTRTGTGKEVSEFYTAYDYPVIVTETRLHQINQENKPFWSVLYNKREESVTASQGYVIELNDMHGKPKARWSYAENNDKPIPVQVSSTRMK